MVRSKLKVPGQIEVIPIRYGYFDAFRFWFPFWTRRKPIEQVYTQIRVALQKYKRDHPDAKLSIIAHSFGTYVVGQILKRGFDLQIHRLILCGSVLPQDFPWHEYQGRFDDDKVVNECGKSDIWPVLAQSASWGYGASGTHGFGAVLVKDRFHAGGHGQYFEPEFVERYWEPFIRRGEYQGTEFETKMPATPWWISVLGILPFKSALLACFVLIILLSYIHIDKAFSITDEASHLQVGGPSSQAIYLKEIASRHHEALIEIDDGIRRIDTAKRQQIIDRKNHLERLYKDLEDSVKSGDLLGSGHIRETYRETLDNIKRAFQGYGVDIDARALAK